MTVRQDSAVEAPQEPQVPPNSKPLYVVGVGASAGGLEALEILFSHLPVDTGMAFVVIQHLSPDFDSVMDELLLRKTAMQVHTVEDGMEVMPNAVYLIPPRKEMIISGGRLLLTDKDLKQGLTLPIDTFFRSLAQDCGARGVGVILSGTGSDGSRGIRSIHEAGGLLIVQAQETAKFDGMPKSAIETGVVDLVLPPDQIAAALSQYAVNPVIAELAEFTDTVPVNEDGMNRLMRLLRESYGIDFSLYKPTTVRRRIERRLLLNQSLGFDEYIAHVDADPRELNTLYHDLLIGVTRFFRDPDAFRIIEREVLPDLIARKGPTDELRIWVAGCATGEEAYSLAILVQEAAAKAGRPVNAKIFATDVHPSSLETAGMGLYSEEALQGLSDERRQKYFVRKVSGYQVNQELRQLVVFARHNVIKDAPFTRLDLITCRNLLIYLQPAVQKKVISLFHFGLRTGGTLFLGPSEGVADLGDEFQTIDLHWKIYRKLRDARLTTDVRLLPPGLGSGPPIRLARSHWHPAVPPVDGQLAAAYLDIMERYIPPAVLINEQREVVHVFGSAAEFLHIKPGPKSNDVLDMFDTELRTAVAGAIQRATKEKSTVAYTGVTLKRNGESRQIKLGVVPIAAKQSDPRYMLITLDELQPLPAPVAEVTATINLAEETQDRMARLEAELRHTKENLQSTIEELETSNEELHATNEELVASNEELQSTNEELHSVNEELYTVNAEYQRKITQLSELTEDMDNLLSSTDVGVLFLDRGLSIRKFTPRLAQLFNIVEQDIGRAFEHFSHSIQHPDLMKDVQWVLSRGQPFEKDVQDRNGRWFFLRILPYQSKADVEGVVLTLVDIQTIKEAESKLVEKQQQLEGVLNNSPAFVFVKDLEGRYILANRRSRRVFGVKAGHVLGKTDYELLPRTVANRLTARDRQVADLGKAIQIEEVIPRDGKGRTYVANVYPLRDGSGKVVATAGIYTDITRQKLAERRAHAAVRQRDHFFAMLSHELRNPLSAIASASENMQSIASHDEHLQQVCSVIQRQSYQLSRLLDDLLDISRVTQGKVELRKEVLDLRVTTQAAVDAARSAVARRQHELIVEIPDEPVWVEGDSARLQQIQVNLLVNACKYTPEGGKIQLRLTASDGKGFIVVTDTGIGLTKDFQKRIFEPFVQSKRSLQLSDGGLGLGLALVRLLVEMHDGDVEVHSDGRDKGSEFTVSIPLTTRRPPAPNHEPNALAVPRQPLKVLVIDDNADIRQMTQMLLEAKGFQVRTASDGLAGLTAIEVERPDVALVDIGLPQIDGYEVARRTRQHNDRAFLVAITGYGREEDRKRATDAGFDEHLTKPVRFEDLWRILDRVTLRQGLAQSP